MPHSSTQKWICSSARRVSVIGIAILCGKRRPTATTPRQLSWHPAHMQPRAHSPHPPAAPAVPSARARAWAGLTAVIAVASITLQYAVLLASVGDTGGTGQALLRLLGYFTILSNIGVAAVCLARLRGRTGGMAAPHPAPRWRCISASPA